MKKKGTLSLSLQSKPDPAVPEWQNNAIAGKQKIPVIFRLVPKSKNITSSTLRARHRRLEVKPLISSPLTICNRRARGRHLCFWIAPLTLSVGARLP